MDYLERAHIHFVDFIDPGPLPGYDHCEVDVSELGVTSDPY